MCRRRVLREDEVDGEVAKRLERQGRRSGGRVYPAWRSKESAECLGNDLNNLETEVLQRRWTKSKWNVPSWSALDEAVQRGSYL